MAGERERLFAKCGKAKRRFEIGDMDNQRIETRAPFCLENARYGPALCGVRAEPVHCLGRERGQAARANNLRGLFNRRLVRLNDHAISTQRRRQKRKSNVTIPEIIHFPAIYNKSVRSNAFSLTLLTVVYDPPEAYTRALSFLTATKLPS